MQKLRDRLALLLEEFRRWNPNEPPRATARELGDRFNLEVQTVLRIARSEGFRLVIDRTVTRVPAVPGYVNPDQEPTAPVDGPPESSDDIPIGTEIGRYQILERLGEGGMGVVYVALDPDLNRRIAIKLLKASVAESTDESPDIVRARLLREAQAMAQLSHHPNIIPIYDVGTFVERVFIAMEYIEGLPINEFIAKYDLDWEDTIYLYLKAAKGLICAHEAGLVHRDFKPDNVLVDDDRRVKVMDFGLTRREGKNPTMVFSREEYERSKKQPLEAKLTETGQIMGTPAYMAPEQFLVQPVDPRSDQFAFCVSLFEALAGFRPYKADSFTELARAVLNHRVVSPPNDSNVPEWIWDAIYQGLRTDPDDRWSTMHDLCDALVEPPPHVKVERRKKWLKRLAILAFPVLGGVGGFIAHEFTNNEPPPPVEPVTSVPDQIWISPQSAYTDQQIHTTISEHEHEFVKCYAAVHRNTPDLTGRVDVRFSVNSKGQITSAEIVKDTFEDLRIGQCIVSSSLFWAFPEPELVSKADVTYPFIFSPRVDPGVGTDQ